jgi:hypothetical protein
LKSALPSFKGDKSIPSDLFGGDHFFGRRFDFVSVITLDADDHEGAVALELTIANQVAKRATARERRFAKIFLVLHLFQSAGTDVRCKNRTGEEKQDEQFENLHHGHPRWLEPSYIDKITKIFTNTHEKQGLSGVYDGIVIRLPRLRAIPRPGQQGIQSIL